MKIGDGIGYCTAQDLRERGCLMLGDRSERRNTVEHILGSWKQEDGPLVVLDRDGRLFERYGGRGLLVDFESANSAVPDVYDPILNHPRYGRTPRESAKLICEVMVRDAKDRTSNDQFWSMNGREVMQEYTEYGLLMSYFANIGMIDSWENSLLDFSASHRMLSSLMDRLAAYGEDETERWGARNEHKPITLSSRDKRNPAPETLSEEELLLSTILINLYGEGSIPFQDTLVSHAGKNSLSNTTNCILKSARAIGGAFLEFIRRLADDEEFYGQLDKVDLNRFAGAAAVPAEGTEDAARIEDTADYCCSALPNIIFVVNCADTAASSAAALLTLLGCTAAADSAKREITCLIPDIADWDIFDGISKLKEIFPRALKLLAGCGDFGRASRRTDLSAAAYFDRITDMTGGNIVWHRSQDEFLKRAFKEHTSGLSLMYGVQDLGGNRLAAIERRGEISYAYIPEAGETGLSPARRKEREYGDTDKSKLWWNSGIKLSLPHEEQDEESGARTEMLFYISPEADAITDEIWGGGSDESE